MTREELAKVEEGQFKKMKEVNIKQQQCNHLLGLAFYGGKELDTKIDKHNIKRILREYDPTDDIEWFEFCPLCALKLKDVRAELEA